MAFHSVVTMEKPLQHISLADWNARVARLRNVADARRSDAFALRHSARTLRNETRIEGDWANVESNEALADRITELNSWREIISKTFERIEDEIKLLLDEKTLTERELDALAGPIAVVSEVLTMRDSRLGSEMTYDEADREIKNELAILENNQQLLAERCQRAWEKLTRLEEVRYKIGMEIENKVEAVDLDTVQLALDRNSATLSYKPDPLRNPKNCCSYEAWLGHVKSMKLLAENELTDTSAIREALFVCREKARNMLQAQQERAEYTIRKRIFETQRARNELEWQKLKMKEEMENAVCEINALEDALRDKSSSLKLAETRLENRAQRSGMELCLDHAHDTLCTEVEKLREIRRSLRAKIDDARANYNLLSDHAQKIDVDLENKQHSLMTDIRALDLRVRLRAGEFGLKVTSPSGQTDRNIVLTHMEQEIPKS
ncbi:tektin-B1 [Drosophila grimshawi]|uniref:Tektin n=1 Tax=Drosophila grimshawi TaxID=7222 RepID=B4JWL6_DROGR|nr:tektin-B1 [Drosophila grimshawi]EDV98354.1 GH22718 [Drosophila grimshawi]